MALLLNIGMNSLEGKANLPRGQFKGKRQFPPMTIEVILGRFKHFGRFGDTEQPFIMQ